MKRRTLLRAGGTVAVAALLPRIGLAMAGRPGVDYHLVVEETPIALVPGGKTPAFTYNGGFPAPVIRARQGVPLRVRVTNRLSQETTVHWHGLRIDNAMDGVPHLTQRPIQPGETFDYEFVCPDAGTFWYHPHTHSIEQLGRGLVGVLIVDEAQPAPFDGEVVLGLKDWRLRPDGSFLPLSEPRQAARTGTLGTVATVNGRIKPVIDVPAGQMLRLRLLNMDSTRLFHLSLGERLAQVVAIDGHPVASPYPLDVHAAGSGMRLDLGLRTPARAGVEIPVYDVKGRFRQEICRLRTVAAAVSDRIAVPALPPNPLPVPDLADADTRQFLIEWAGALSAGSGSTAHHDFWTINRRAWEGMDEHFIPEPLTTLERGKTYVFELHNASPHRHPMHIHGLTFAVLESDKRRIEPFHSDTVLMERNERMKVAVVADNPGRWMFHCHVIEHMKTGLMGYIAVR